MNNFGVLGRLEFKNIPKNNFYLKITSFGLIINFFIYIL